MDCDANSGYPAREYAAFKHLERGSELANSPGVLSDQKMGIRVLGPNSSIEDSLAGLTVLEWGERGAFTLT